MMAQATTQHRGKRILAVLGGGRSSRFGGSKLEVSWRGEPILTWQARLREWAGGGGEVWLNLPWTDDRETDGATRRWPGWEQYDRVIRDEKPYLGPLSGIMTILSAANPADWVAAVPADMPRVRMEHLSLLAQPLENTSVAVSMGRLSGHVEPLPSVWRAGLALPRVRALLEQGGGPRQMADDPAAAVVPLDSSYVKIWQGFNTRDEYERLHAEDDAKKF